MTPRRRPRQSWIQRTNWSALQFAMFLLVTIIGGFMGYAFISGKTATTIENHERRIDALEGAMRDLHRRP